MSLSSNTSMGVCAFHAGSLNTVPVASPWRDADEPRARYTDARAGIPPPPSRPGDDANHASAAPADADVAFFPTDSAEDALDSGAYG